MDDARGPDEQPRDRVDIRATRTGWRARLIDDSRTSGTKMLRLLRIACTVQIVQGVLEIIIGVAFAAIILSSSVRVDPLLVGVPTALSLVVGPARIVAGRRNRDFRSRWLAIATAIAGLPSIACGRLPTSPFVLILVVRVHRSGLIREAFGLRDEGRSRSEVERWLHRPLNPRRAE